MIEDQNLVENKVHLAFDKEVFKILAEINRWRSDREYKMDFNPEIFRMGQYYNAILDHIVFYGDIKPVVLESVYNEIKNDKNTIEFVKEFGLYTDKNYSNFGARDYDRRRNELARKYCEPFVYKDRKYEAPFKMENGVPEKKAYVVADATVNHCQLIVANPLNYIAKVNETVKNERTLGIMEVNYKLGYCRFRKDGKITTKPMAVSTIGPMLRDENLVFYAPFPLTIVNKNCYEEDVMSR